MESRHGPLSPPDSPFLPTGGPPPPASPGVLPTVGLGQGLRAGLPCCGREAEWGASPAGEEPGSRARSSGGRGQERGARAAGSEGGGAQSPAGSWRRPGSSPQGCGAPAALARTFRRGAGKRGSSGRSSLSGLSLTGRVQWVTWNPASVRLSDQRGGHGKTVGPKGPSGPKGSIPDRCLEPWIVGWAEGSPRGGCRTLEEQPLNPVLWENPTGQEPSSEPPARPEVRYPPR